MRSTTSRLAARSQQIPLRLILVVPFVLQILAVMGLTGYFSYRNGQQAINDLAYQLTDEAGDRIDQNLSHYLSTSAGITRNNANLLELGILDWQNLSSLKPYLWRQLAAPGVNGILVATEQKDILIVEKRETGALIERIADRSTNRAFENYLVDRQHRRIRLLRRSTTYNPHNDPPGNPWYGEAKAKGKSMWWRLVVARAEADKGILVAANFLPFYDPTRQLRGVLSSGVNLTQLNQFLASLKIGQTGKAFIVERNGLLIATSSGEAPFHQGLLAPPTSKNSEQVNTDPARRRLSAVDSQNPLMRQISQRLVDRFGSFDRISSDQQISLEIDRQRYFVNVKPLKNDQGLDWLTVIVVPEADFVAQINANTQTTILLSLLALGAAIGCGILTARWVTKPILWLNRAAKQIADGELTQRVPIDRQDEVGELANSFNQMAAQLQTSFAEMQSLNQALAASESQLKNLLETLPIGVSLHNADGTIAYFNHAAKQLLGIETIQDSTADQLSATYHAYRSGTDQQYPIADLPAVRAVRGETVQVEDMEIRRDGTVTALNVHATPIRDESGAIVYAVVAFQDISKRRQAETILAYHNRTLAARVAERTRELQNIQERLQLIIDGNNEGIWDENLETGLIFRSPRWKEILGYQDYEEISKDIWSHLHPDDFMRVMQHRSSYLDRKSTNNAIEHRMRCKNGGYKWVLSRMQAVWNETGVVRLAGSMTDISDRRAIEAERKQTQAELKAQQAFLRQVVDAIPTYIFVKDRQGRFMMVNQAAAAVHGVTVEELLGKGNPFIEPAQLKEFLAQNQQVMETLQPLVISPQAIRNAQGETRWYKTVISPFLDLYGQVQGIIGAATDITDFIQVEEELRQTKEAAEAANKAKSAFLANMSHELRTPLNAILGFSQLLAENPDTTPDQQEDLAIIDRSGEHLLKLINSVLDLSKIEAGQIVLDESPVDLHHLLSELEAMLQLRVSAKGLKFVVERSLHLPRYVQTDEGKLRQILLNLLGNAIKFTSVGQIVLRAGNPLPANPDAYLLHFEVEDTGLGIAPHELEKLFQPFVQTESGRRSQQGTGLGLAISRKFVQLLGGDIRVRSALGVGTCFEFEIQAKPLQTPAPQQMQLRRVVGLEPGQPHYRILVVDDVQDNGRLLVKRLKAIGFDLQVAENGQEAIELWQTWQPHLIWMDMQMPVLDGYETTRQIRTIEASQGKTPVKIIALTASAFEDEREPVLAAGCDDFVRKPVTSETILRTIAQHLDLRYRCEPSVLSRGADSETLPQWADELVAADIGVMPPDWIAQLHDAAQSIDEARIRQLIEQIPPDHAPLADAIADLAYNFRFDLILELAQTEISLTSA